MAINTRITPIPQHLLSECADIMAAPHTPRLVLNTYHTIAYTDALSSEFMEYFCLDSRIGHTVCCETVTVNTLPTHRDVFNQIGQRQRQCHAVLNCEPRSITLTVGGEDILLLSNHWYLLHSQTPHGAVCEPPHSVITVDAWCDYDAYRLLLSDVM